MRLAIAPIAIVIAAATSLVAVGPVFAQGNADVVIAAAQDEPAREWAIDVVGGTASTDHVTLAPVAVGVQADFTVSVAGSKAKVTLTTVLPSGRQLSTVGCLDDLNPPTEIAPVVDASAFTLEVVSGRQYRCFVASLPSGVAPPAVAAAPAVQTPSHKALPGRTRPRYRGHLCRDGSSWSWRSWWCRALGYCCGRRDQGSGANTAPAVGDWLPSRSPIDHPAPSQGEQDGCRIRHGGRHPVRRSRRRRW